MYQIWSRVTKKLKMNQAIQTSIPYLIYKKIKVNEDYWKKNKVY